MAAKKPAGPTAETIPAALPGAGGSTAPATPLVVEGGGSAAEVIEQQAEQRAEAAEQETAKVAEAGRLPENSAIANPSPATEMESPSGAFVEPEIKQAIPVDHPAIDNNPRQGTSGIQNGQDFNDPAGRTPDQQDFAGQGIDPTPYGDAFKSTKSAS